MAPPLRNVIKDTSAPLLQVPLAKRRTRPSGVPPCDLRVLGDEHAAEMGRLLASLEPDARRTGFGHDASITAHVQHALSDATRIIGAFVDEELRGLLEIYAHRVSDPVRIVLVVEQAWRRRGLGWRLLQGAMRWADDANAGPLRLTFARHNWPMRQLCSKASARFDLNLDEICADIHPQKRAPSDQR